METAGNTVSEIDPGSGLSGESSCRWAGWVSYGGRSRGLFPVAWRPAKSGVIPALSRNCDAPQGVSQVA